MKQSAGPAYGVGFTILMMMHWASPNDITEGKPRQFSHDVNPSLLTSHQCGKPGLTIQM